MSEKRPLNGFFVCIYYLVNLVAGILHPVTIIGRENLPEHGALLCPNHNSNWDPVLVALKVPVNYRLHIMAKGRCSATRSLTGYCGSWAPSLLTGARGTSRR